MTKVAIVGSRSYQSSKQLTAACRREIAIEVATRGYVEIVSGGADGPDTWGAEAAERYDLPLKVFPAEWATYGRSAGFKRNQQIVDYCDEIVAFWDGKSKGTLDTITKGVRAGKKVTICNPIPSIKE